MFLIKWRWGDSNPRPQACKACALPTELHPHETEAYIKFYSFLCQGAWVLKIFARLYILYPLESPMSTEKIRSILRVLRRTRDDNSRLKHVPNGLWNYPFTVTHKSTGQILILRI